MKKFFQNLLVAFQKKTTWSAIFTIAGLFVMTFWGKQVVVSGEVIDALITLAGVTSQILGWSLAYSADPSPDSKNKQS